MDQGFRKFGEVFSGQVVCHCTKIIHKDFQEVGGEGSSFQAVEVVALL